MTNTETESETRPEPQKNTTRYVVQARVTAERIRVLSSTPGARVEGHVSEGLSDRKIWVDLGVYVAPSGAKRSAINSAMTAHGLEEGDFRAIPESSVTVEHARVKKQTVWT